MEILRPKDVSKILHVTVRTLQEWDRTGKFKAKRTPTSNRRYYTRDQINEYLGLGDRISDKVVIYARVSSNEQNSDLDNQVEFLKQYANAKGYIVDEIITEIGSGLNYNRKKWNDLLRQIEEKRIVKVIISHEDRFIRFGYDWFMSYAERYGCQMEVANNEATSPKEEMVTDLTSIIHSFGSRIYGLRKYKKKISEDKDL